MTFLDTARSTALTMKQQAGTSMSQVGNKLADNAKHQKALRGVSDDLDFSSGYTNPFKVHESEKYDVMDEIRDRHTGTWRTLVDRTIGTQLTPGLIQLALQGGFLDAAKTLIGVQGQVTSQLVKLGELRAAGWKLMRLSDMWAAIVKQFSVNAESSIRLEAPVITEVAMMHATEAHVHTVTADLKAVIVKDEIHRVADAFGIDANFLTALIQATAKIHATGALELASGATSTLSSVGKTSIVSAAEVKVSAPLHSITDGAGGSITMTAGIINLNPIVPVLPEVPTVILPTILVSADSWPRATVFKSQYEGANPHGTNVV